jgi:hypothetical protein
MCAPRRLHPPIGSVAQPTNCSPFGFEAQTKKPMWWFWGPNHQTVLVSSEAKMGQPITTSFEAKPGEAVTTGFKDKPRENRRHRFWGQTGENHPSGFEVKPLTNRPSGFETKPLINRRPWFWGSIKKPALLIFTCTVQTAHRITRSPDRLIIEYPTCVIIPDPLHQVSNSCTILIAAPQAAPATCTPWDKQTRFSKQNKDKGKTNETSRIRI